MFIPKTSASYQLDPARHTTCSKSPPKYTGNVYLHESLATPLDKCCCMLLGVPVSHCETNLYRLLVSFLIMRLEWASFLGSTFRTNKDFNQLSSRGLLLEDVNFLRNHKCKNLSLIRGTKMPGSLGGSTWHTIFINSSIHQQTRPGHTFEALF